MPSAPVEPPLVNIRLVGARIAPSKSDGTPWDYKLGGKKVPPQLPGRIASVLGVPTSYVQVGAILLEPAVEALAKPEPFGTAKLLARGKTTPASLPRQHRDTLNPQWSGAEWRQVRLEPGLQVLVTLVDKDVRDDDPIGNASITYPSLEKARQSGKVEQVEVADQTDNQLLFVGVLVSPAQ